MIETTEPAITAAPPVQGSTRSATFAVALMSFSALLLELGLTRLFSVVLFYHFAFLAISIALLGLGAGAVFAFLQREWLERWSISQLGATLCAVNAAIILLALEIVLHSSVSMHLDWGNFGRLTMLYLAAAVPFCVTGLLFSMVFARHPTRITQLYGADLLGGSLACLALVPLLNLIGGPNTILFAAVAVALAGVAWAHARARWAPAALALLLMTLIAVNFHGRLIDIVYAKGMKRITPLFAKWNALSRVEVDDQGWAKVIVIDADASTYLMNADPHRLDDRYQRDLMSAVPALVNVLRPKGDYAIIGPGGGVDVQRAVANGSPSVTGIEINPIIANDIMRDRFADYAHHLYQIPEVHIHVSDGRSFIRNSRDKYDVVQMTLVDTWASTAAGAFALSENNLYTVEAFREYFEHLKPDGMIAITRWEFTQPREALRVVSQAMEALRQLGVEDSTGNFIVASDGPLDADGRPVLVLAKKAAFTEEEQLAVLRYIKGATPSEARLNLYVLYLPATGDRPGLAHPAFAGLIRSQDARAFSTGYAYNVAPVTDNAPFFFFTLKPEQVFHDLNRGGIDWKVNLGIAILGLLLLLSIAAVILFLVVPLALSSQARSGRNVRLLYFIAIGLGYILVEIAFIQRFVLFLGNPTYALTVVIFLMLLSSGIGSLLSRRWFRQPTRVVWAMAVIVLALLICVFVLPRVLEMLVGLPFVMKLVISAAVLVPLGLAMGMPFPSGLRALSSHVDSDLMSSIDSGAVEWAWAMNAASSVLGSVLAMVIAIQFGLNVTLACAAAVYLLAMLLLITSFAPEEKT
jgi:spermidine synthase